MSDIENALRSLIDEHWIELEAQEVSGPHMLRVSELPVDAMNGGLAAAVDHEGYRHLLVPVNAHQKVRRRLDGPVLTLRKRALESEETFQSYADLGCRRTDLNDVFTGLCADVLKTTEAQPSNPIKALYSVLDRWKSLFQTSGAPLGAEQLVGLFAELTVLIRLLESDSGAHRLWTGPSGHRHDFATVTRAVEVKASTSAERRRMRIHGLDQLEAPGAGGLHLAWFRVARTSDHGDRLVGLVERALHLCEDESTLRGLLAEAGYLPADMAAYHDIRFTVVEERWYEVGVDFPKLIGHDLAAAGIPITVLDVHYTIDLSSESPIPLDHAQVHDHLFQMIQESS